MRCRIVNPRFFTHGLLFDAEQATGLPLRLAFAGLWCAADREGRFRWEPRVLKLAILPYDPVDFSAVLHALGGAGFVRRYGPAGEWGDIPGFTVWQKPHAREAASHIPAYDAPFTGEGEAKNSPRPSKNSPRRLQARQSPPVAVAVAVAVTDTVTESVTGTVGTRTARPDTWLTPYLETWKAAGGVLSPGRAAKALAPIHEQIGAQRGAGALTAYLAAGKASYGIEVFARSWKELDARAQGFGMSEQEMRSQAAMDAFTGGPDDAR